MHPLIVVAHPDPDSLSHSVVLADATWQKQDDYIPRRTGRPRDKTMMENGFLGRRRADVVPGSIAQ